MMPNFLGRFGGGLLLALGVAAVPAPALAGSQDPPPAAGRTVAITFDDLPYVHGVGAPGAPATIAAAKEANRRILAALARAKAPATGFVTESRARVLGPAARDLLRPWNAGRNELANHGFAHADSNGLDLDAIRRDVVDGEATIGPMAASAGRKLRFFRFPFNHVGDSDAKRAAIEAMLAGRGYTLAASTIDTSDYLFDQAHERAIAAGDTAMQRRIRRAYLDHSRGQIAYYADLNRQVLGREPPAVMLLHLNRLNAAVIDPLLGLFRAAGYRFVPLAEAQADPAYVRPPAFATRFGPMWGYRWARERGIRVDGSREAEPADWIAAYAEGRAAPAVSR